MISHFSIIYSVSLAALFITYGLLILGNVFEGDGLGIEVICVREK